MALQMKTISLIATLVAVLCTGAAAQSSCTNVIVGLSPCLNYITGNSSTPSSSCCSQLSSVVRSQPQCLCQVLNGGGSQLGLNINQTQALQLPNACNVQTPPISQCNAAAPPADSPAGTSDTPTSSGTDIFVHNTLSVELQSGVINPNGSNPFMHAGNGSKTVPSPDVDSSMGSSTALPSIMLLLLSAISYASF